MKQHLGMHLGHGGHKSARDFGGYKYLDVHDQAYAKKLNLHDSGDAAGA